MKNAWMCTFLLFTAYGLVGCVGNGGGVNKPVVLGPPADIELECKSANRLGCRYKGRVYPWNAWVEKMGYQSTRFVVKDVKQSGNKAAVLLVER